MTAAVHTLSHELAVRERTATRPAEVRGVDRDGVRMLVARNHGLEHTTFRHVAEHLRSGDVLVVNTSATVPGALQGRRENGEPVRVHVSTRLDDGSWIIELRSPDGSGRVRDGVPGERVKLDSGAMVELLRPRYEHRDGGVRLWAATIDAPSSVELHLAQHGRPIAYGYLDGEWPMSFYETIFGLCPGSAEMASAARPFTWRVLRDVTARGVHVVPITLHTGVSSLEAGEPPQPERMSVSAATAGAVNRARRAGGRIVAVGTTATRALESAADEHGIVHERQGWTDLVLGTERPARVVDGLITGWHETDASHIALLHAVAGEELVDRAYLAARSAGYLWHEFGDSCLLLPTPG